MRKNTGLMLPLLLALTACTSGMVSEGREIAPGQYKDRLEVENYELYSRLSIKDVKMRRLGDLLNVQLTLHHEQHQTRRYQYRFKWFDAQGFELNPESTGWQPVELHGKQDYSVTGTAPSPAADTFRIVFREQ